MTFLAEGGDVNSQGRAQVIGTGLIGGSVAMALREAGWHVTGSDVDEATEAAALEADAVDVVGDDPDADLVVICTPSAQVVEVARSALSRNSHPGLIVTDVAGVKAPIVDAIEDPRFVGGHPMAGSEQLGAAGARSDLFVGAIEIADDLRETVVSHVPHLVASALMNEAASVAESDAALLLLAAGGFRDMTRVAAGDPTIWPDVCVENATAILEGLDALEVQISSLRRAIATQDREALHAALTTASQARRALPGRSADPEQLAEVRIPVPDRPGVLAQVTSTASELGLSVVDVEIAHSVEGGRGVLIVVVARDEAARYARALQNLEFTCSVVDL